MQAFQQRVIDERDALNLKRTSLESFIVTEHPAFVGLADEDKALLREQLDVMTAYAGILDKRIARFAP